MASRIFLQQKMVEGERAARSFKPRDAKKRFAKLHGQAEG